MGSFRSVRTLFALGLAIACGFGSDAADQDVSRDTTYPGAFFLYQMPEVTVVYPAGPGEDVATNRLSATARARFLEATRGTRTRVLADVDATPEDLKANLLVLGWRNALLGTEKAPRPFTLDDGVLRLLDTVIGQGGDDVLVYSRSPYDSEHFLVFWSRIDPESDRFMVLPRVGSDWAIYRRYKIVKQGMFKPGSDWPPMIERDAMIDREPMILSDRGRERSHKTDHYDIRYDPRSIRSEAIEEVGRAREKALTRAAGALGASLDRVMVSLHVYADDEAMTEATGVDDPAHSIPGESELHMALRIARLPAPHEEYHLLARRLYGPAFLTAMYEGLSHALDGVQDGLDLDVHAGLLLDADAWPLVGRILDEEILRVTPPEQGPVAMGLLVSWLRSTLPAERFAAAYGLREGTIDALAAAIGRPASGIETAFRAWGVERAAARKGDVVFLKAQAEASERLKLADYRGVAAALRKALKARPDDPQTLFNLASALMRTDDFEDASAIFRKLVDSPLQPRDSRFRIFSHYQLGRTLDIQGRRTEALAQYEKVLELPDEYDAHRLARERIESPATRDHLE